MHARMITLTHERPFVRHRHRTWPHRIDPDESHGRRFPLRGGGIAGGRSTHAADERARARRMPAVHLETMAQTGSKPCCTTSGKCSRRQSRAALPAHPQRARATPRSRRAIVVPNTQVAHLARLGFGVGDYKLFYDDFEAAKRFLRDASPFSSADWSIRVTEERRLRERRLAPRHGGGRRERDRMIG